MSDALDLDAIKARTDAATEGPWEAGDWWHIQGAEFCPCRSDWGPAVVQKMRINGTLMLAHRHRRATPIVTSVINTEPYADGFPRTVVLTTEEYGAIGETNAEFIAHAREDIPALVAEVERLESIIERAHHESIAGDGRSSVVLAVVRGILAEGLDK